MFPIRKLAPHWSNPATVEERMTNTKTFKIRKDNNEVVSVNLERLVKLPSHARMDAGKYHTEEQVETKEAVEESEDDDEDWWPGNLATPTPRVGAGRAVRSSHQGPASRAVNSEFSGVETKVA